MKTIGIDVTFNEKSGKVTKVVLTDDGEPLKVLDLEYLNLSVIEIVDEFLTPPDLEAVFEGSEEEIEDVEVDPYDIADEIYEISERLATRPVSLEEVKEDEPTD